MVGNRKCCSTWMAAGSGSGRERLQAILGGNRYSELPIVEQNVDI